MTELIYIPTPTTQRGIAEVAVVPADKLDGTMTAKTPRGHVQWFLGREEGVSWFKNKNAALAASENLRMKRIKSLERQIAALNKFGPFA